MTVHTRAISIWKYYFFYRLPLAISVLNFLTFAMLLSENVPCYLAFPQIPVIIDILSHIIGYLYL